MNEFTVQPQSSRYSSDEKLLIIACHLSGFLGVPFILPLIIYLVKKDEPGPVAAHAKETLNFHISLIIYFAIAAVLLVVGIGFLLFPIIGFAWFVLAIVAALKASDSIFYRYPACIRFL